MAKKNSGGFDESAFLEAMSQGHGYSQKPEPKTEIEGTPDKTESLPRPAPRRRTGEPSEYESLFLTMNDPVKERTFIGIRPEYYRTLSVIVKRLGSGLSLQGLVDNIIRHHLESYAGEINRLNREATKKDIL